MALSEEERKVIRGAIKRVAETDDSSVTAIFSECYSSQRTSAYELKEKFRNFYDEWGCPLANERDSWQLQTTRILLLETFLIFDGEV